MKGRIPTQSHCQSSPAWLVSFGDLLTLVLCVFISILSTSGMRTKDNRDNNQGVRGSADIIAPPGPETANVQNSGTPFAHLNERSKAASSAPKQNEAPGARVTLDSEDFHGSTIDESGRFGRMWDEKVVPKIALISSVELTLCGAGQAESQERAVSVIKFLTEKVELTRVSVVIHEFACSEIAALGSAAIGFVDIS